MLTFIKTFKTTGILASATVLSLLMAANTQAIVAGDDSSLSIDPAKIYTEGLPNTNFNKSFSQMPEGVDSTWEATKDDDGYHFEAGFSGRKNVDFSNKFVNTSGNTDVVVFDMGMGVDGGIGLGCNGLDMGLEALFNFDAGDILEYLPQYIMTNLAVEALAQIYATPLVSTIMDGLKAMNNAVAEFKQASCDMNKVMSRANEIKSANYNECIDEVNASGGKKDGKPADAYCSDPTGLQKTIENAQKKFSNWAPISDAVEAIFPEELGTAAGGDYSATPVYHKETDINSPNYGKMVDSNGNPAAGGRGMSKGKLIAAILPNIKFGNSKSKADVALPEAPLLTVMDTYNRANNSSRNYVIQLYSDIFKSMRKKKFIFESEQEQALNDYDRYKDYVINIYGSQAVYADDNPNNSKKPTAEEIQSIKDQYKRASVSVIESSLTQSGHKGFKIGPEDGPRGGFAIPANQTDTLGLDNEMLELADLCWVKTKVDKDNYKWAKVQQDPNVVLNVPATNMDKMIDNVAKCTVASEVKMLTYHSYISTLKHNGLKEAYLRMISAEAAYSATENIIKSINFLSNTGIATDTQKLRAFCMAKTNNGNNMSIMPKLATYDNVDKQTFKNCDDYSDQMKLSEDKKEFLINEEKKRNDELELLKNDVDKVVKRYEELKELYGNVDRPNL